MGVGSRKSPRRINVRRRRPRDPGKTPDHLTGRQPRAGQNRLAGLLRGTTARGRGWMPRGPEETILTVKPPGIRNGLISHNTIRHTVGPEIGIPEINSGNRAAVVRGGIEQPARAVAERSKQLPRARRPRSRGRPHQRVIYNRVDERALFLITNAVTFTNKLVAYECTGA